MAITDGREGMAVSTAETLIGVDFSGASKGSEQRKKIIGIAATRIEPGLYYVTPDGFNTRLVQQGRPPGWTAEELAEALLRAPARVVAFDFPFSIPISLLNDADFAAAVGHSGAFGTWAEFNRFIAGHLSLRPPTDLAPFAAWRSKAYWLKRATDIPAGAQPALKHMFQVLFNMTLLGNALLASLGASGRYRIIPFDETGPENEVIEIYPGVTMRSLRFAQYKQDPVGAIDLILGYCASNGISIEVDPTIRDFCETYSSGSKKALDPDGSDALIALATAVLYREGLGSEVIEPGERHRRLVEGVIWGPGVSGKLRQRSVGRSPALPLPSLPAPLNPTLPFPTSGSRAGDEIEGEDGEPEPSAGQGIDAPPSATASLTFNTPESPVSSPVAVKVAPPNSPPRPKSGFWRRFLNLLNGGGDA